MVEMAKCLIMGFLSNILKDYATTAEADFLTSKMRNGIFMYFNKC
jgi:hypothetical protein